MDPIALLQGPSKQPSIRYSGLVLDQASKLRLADVWGHITEPGYTFVGDHVTSCLGPFLKERERIGSTRTVQADALGFNPTKTVAALRIRDFTRQDGKQAHLTLVVKDGARAEESNDIREWEPLKKPLSLHGTLTEVPEADAEPVDVTAGVTRLCFLDFDGCLVDTPEPEPGKQAWSTHYGQPYPTEGWWGRAESLDPTIWPMKRVIQGYQAYRRERGNAQARLVLLTNRIGKLAPQVKVLLDKHGYRLDALTFREGSESKADRVAVWLRALPGVTSVLVLDDHDSYLAPIRELQTQFPNVKIETQLVDRAFQPSLRESFDKINKILTP